MLTESQCIEVAEKIWGCHTNGSRWWRSKDDIQSHNIWLMDYDAIQKEVNSWTGFGRTVEAMAGKNIIIEVVAKHYTDYLRGAITKEQLWEATHLAALEAGKEGKSE